MEYVVENWDAIIAVFGALFGLLVAIANLVPNPKEGSAMYKLHKFVDALSLLFNKKNKEPKVEGPKTEKKPDEQPSQSP